MPFFCVTPKNDVLLSTFCFVFFFVFFIFLTTGTRPVKNDSCVLDDSMKIGFAFAGKCQRTGTILTITVIREMQTHGGQTVVDVTHKL